MRKLTLCVYLDSVPFTLDVLQGKTSLGGSESACMGLMKALAARGHNVHAYATKLDDAAVGDHDGVFWHSAEQELATTMAFVDPDVFISLRMPDVFMLPSNAKLNVLWAQDLLIDKHILGGVHPVIDLFAYVSQYHQQQWEGVDDACKGRGWVTGNGWDPAHLPNLDGIVKKRRRFIHISRPERGYDALLQLWPKIRDRWPDATLQLCRYSSMYDAGGWGQVVRRYEAAMKAMGDKVGGVEFLGQLNKVDLYRKIAAAEVMLYPSSQPNFAETNCIAATEAQACATPFVGSNVGALPETVDPMAGTLIDGDPMDPAVQDRFIEALAEYDSTQDSYWIAAAAGRAKADRVTYDRLAEQWEQRINATFVSRVVANPIGVLRQLVNDDNIAPALQLCDVLADTEDSPFAPLTTDQRREVEDTAAMCRRVITQEEQTAEHYAQFAIQDPLHEAKMNARLQHAAQQIAAHVDTLKRPARILDLACGNGSMALLLTDAIPDCHVTAHDYSPGVLTLAERALRTTLGDEGFAQRVALSHGPFDQCPTGPYDAIFCGEFLEHVEKPWALIDWLETLCRPDGIIVMTTPSGPFGELMQLGQERHRGHVHMFSMRDLTDMLGGKRNYAWHYLPSGVSPRGRAVGYWMFAYQPGGDPAQPLDYDTTILRERPMQRLVAAMIMRDNELEVGRCVESLRGVVDAIAIYDTGSADKGPEIAAARGADVVMGDWPENFAEARNRSVQLAIDVHKADWVLWIDCDEVLEGGPRLRRFVTAQTPYVGYVIRQHHLQLDAPNFFDTPCRVFKVGADIKFYGIVHEQPQQGHKDGDIHPALALEDTRIVHFGYTTDDTRRRKLLYRNLPLLKKELRLQDGARDLAWVLAIRDYLNLGTFDMEANGGKLTPKAVALFRAGIKVYDERGFADPAHKLHRTAWPFYQQILGLLPGEVVTAAWSFAASPGPQPPARVGSEVLRARSADEMNTEIAARMKDYLQPLQPLSIVTTPAVSWDAVGVN